LVSLPLILCFYTVIFLFVLLQFSHKSDILYKSLSPA
jgi:hypothetical protein